jgi:two-component system chemotaxis sensor kinase CheA
MNLDDALQTFIVESHELLESMEEALLHIEQRPDDGDAIGAIFRAAHTIKGSAGLFGLDDIVAFTHVAESVLDRVRSGELRVSPDMAATLLVSGDHIRALVDCAARHTDVTGLLREKGQALEGQLMTYLRQDQPIFHSPKPAARLIGVEPQGLGDDEGRAATDCWHFSLRFGPDVLRNGMDPLSFIRYLSTLGQIEQVLTLLNRIPAAREMDPERCYLGFEIRLKSQADQATLEGVFDFVRDDSDIHLLPPRSPLTHYRALMADLPEEDQSVGNMLVRCATLTAAELACVLRLSGDQVPSHHLSPGEVSGDASLAQAPVKPVETAPQKPGSDARNSETHLIRVDAEKLDQLINLVGELIIAGAGASLIAQHAAVSTLQEAMATVSRLVEEVRNRALTLRMVQIGATFNRFQRVVRDVSKELGKDITLVISGAETELDKTVVEKIGDPLTHLVRNSMDHGIESAELRKARGKPPRGTLHLRAYHDAGSIVIEVADDGGGLNKEKILKKAIERGLVEDGATLSDREIYNLIFEAGFSTADVVSNLSGRGVGMDVVRRNIAALRGTVDLDSVEGLGSTVRIRLPLTLAIIDGFLVGVGNAAYVIPQDMVVQCLELGAADHDSSDKRYLNLCGEVLPYCRLREHFEVQGQRARRENVVVVRYAGQKVGLVVDKLMGEFQTVIKPLGKVFNQVQGIGGFTILGNGDVALILDVPGLMTQVMGQANKQVNGASLVSAVLV